MKVTYTLYTPYTDLAVKYKPKVDVFDRGIDGSYNPTEILRAMHRLQVSGRSIVTRQRLVCKAGARQEVKEKIQPSQKLLLRFFFFNHNRPSRNVSSTGGEPLKGSPPTVIG